MKSLFLKIWEDAHYIGLWVLTLTMGALVTEHFAKESMDWFFGGVVTVFASEVCQIFVKDLVSYINGEYK